jgi:IclR family transcriptional regulator, acetate operon repressor
VGAERVLAVLTALARQPAGVGLDELARTLGAPKPTVHRALAVLRRTGFAVQHSRGRYELGDEFLRLAFAHHEARPEHLRVQPLLEELAVRHGETAHYAVLDGRPVDDQENEPGVHCLAVPAFLGSPSTPSGAVSVSALAYRTPLSTLVDDLPAIRAIVGRTPVPA